MSWDLTSDQNQAEGANNTEIIIIPLSLLRTSGSAITEN